MIDDYGNLLFSVRDRISGTHSGPYMFVNESDMKRRFYIYYRDNPFSSDLEVYTLGIFNPCTGAIAVTPGSPLFFCNMPDIIKEFSDHEKA